MLNLISVGLCAIVLPAADTGRVVGFLTLHDVNRST
jgi:hypothetical protein